MQIPQTLAQLTSLSMCCRCDLSADFSLKNLFNHRLSTAASTSLQAADSSANLNMSVVPISSYCGIAMQILVMG